MNDNNDHQCSPLKFTDKTLSYSGQDCHKIPSTLNKMFGDKVECLDLSFNSLVSLEGISGFPVLRDLILDNNQLTDVRPLPYMPYLTTLSLNNNLITNLDALLVKISDRIPKLSFLSLLGNPACPDQLSDRDKDDADYQRYRYYVIYHLPGLKFLDFRRVTMEEKAEALKRGQFLAVRRPADPPSGSSSCSDSPLPFTTLPLKPPRRPQHKGAFGRCLYKYSGKHSEGNRFICNSDL